MLQSLLQNITAGKACSSCCPFLLFMFFFLFGNLIYVIFSTFLKNYRLSSGYIMVWRKIHELEVKLEENGDQTQRYEYPTKNSVPKPSLRGKHGILTIWLQRGGRITLVWTSGSVYALQTKRRPLRLFMDFCSTFGVVH